MVANIVSNFRIKVWRQLQSESQGHFERHTVKDISADMSFLEMLDVLNEQLIQDDLIPVAFDHDCREGICGACSIVIKSMKVRPIASLMNNNDLIKCQ